jgi:hypothetical protein
MLTANPRTKMLMEKAPKMSDVLLKSLFTKGSAGAKIEDAKGLRKVMAAMRPIMNHLRPSVKFLCIKVSKRLDGLNCRNY